MLFNSYIFIFVFLPVVLIGYFWLNKLSTNFLSLVWLALMSLMFYGYFNPSYLLVIESSIIVNYLIDRLLSGNIRESMRKAILFLGVAFNIGLIFYFKYYDFFIGNMNEIFHVSFELKNIVLPLGISFFTFQQISYVFDSYKGNTKAYTFLEYVVFVTFFPQLVAGPIVLHDELIPQFKQTENRRVQWDNMARGFYLLSCGLFKKVLIADTFGKVVSYGYTNIDTISSLEAAITMLSYTIQIYFDFSGYCDMASGIASMFNIKLPINFDSPYKATSIIEFWKRWHITLTRFLRTYIYFPLGGARKGKARTYINVMIVFGVSGIWHGANWTFVLWGLLHGLANVLNRVFKIGYEKLHIVTQWLITFTFVNVTWAIFRADNIGQGLQMIWKSINMRDFSLSTMYLEQFILPEFNYLYMLMKGSSLFKPITSINITDFSMWGLIIGVMIITLNCKNCQVKMVRYNIRTALLISILFIWSVMSLSGVSVFLYFNF